MRCRECNTPIEQSSITEEGYTCPVCGTTKMFKKAKKTTRATKICICGCKGRKTPHVKMEDGSIRCGSCGRELRNGLSKSQKYQQKQGAST